MNGDDAFRGWLLSYIDAQFPSCPNVPDHLCSALISGDPNELPLFGDSRSAWAQQSPEWGKSDKVNSWEWPERWPNEVLDKIRAEDDFDYDAGFNLKPQVKYGPRGGRYTESRRENGAPYRRYF